MIGSIRRVLGFGDNENTLIKNGNVPKLQNDNALTGSQWPRAKREMLIVAQMTMGQFAIRVDANIDRTMVSYDSVMVNWWLIVNSCLVMYHGFHVFHA